MPARRFCHRRSRPQRLWSSTPRTPRSASGRARRPASSVWSGPGGSGIRRICSSAPRPGPSVGCGRAAVRGVRHVSFPITGTARTSPGTATDTRSRRRPRWKPAARRRSDTRSRGASSAVQYALQGLRRRCKRAWASCSWRFEQRWAAADRGRPSTSAWAAVSSTTRQSTRVRQEHRRLCQVFVPVDPGNAGLAVGAALVAVNGGRRGRCLAIPGSVLRADEIKATLDNCKLRYDWVQRRRCSRAAPWTLSSRTPGRLVRGRDGVGSARAWCPLDSRQSVRAVRAREPEPIPEAARAVARLRAQRARGAVAAHFDGPDGGALHGVRLPAAGRRRGSGTVLPSPTRAHPVQTVDGRRSARGSGSCSTAFGQATGMPFLVNTSFNGFHEPIVCRPRDAVRVFYGSGLDVLVLDRFVLTK